MGIAKYESKLDARWVGMLRERRGERLITDAMPGMIVIGLNELFDEKLKNKRSSDFLYCRFQLESLMFDSISKLYDITIVFSNKYFRLGLIDDFIMISCTRYMLSQKVLLRRSAQSSLLIIEAIHII